MKKNFSIALMLSLSVAISPLIAQPLTGTSWTEAQSSKYALVTLTFVHAPKFAERTQEGTYEGLCFDLWKQFEKYVKETHGIEIKSTVKTISLGDDFTSFLRRVETSKDGVFGLGDVSITPERQRKLSFSSPYFKSMFLLISHYTAPDVTKWNDLPNKLKDHTMVVQRGTTNEGLAFKIRNTWNDMPLYQTTGLEEITTLVTTDPSYYTIMDFSTYLGIKDRNILYKMKRHPQCDSKGDYLGFIMPKNSTWKPVFDAFLQQYVQSIEYKKMLSTYFGDPSMRLITRMFLDEQQALTSNTVSTTR